MNILCIGGWLTGNSAILDYLDGSEEISYVRSDFDLLRQENGIYDLINTTDKSKKLKIASKLYFQVLNDLYNSVKFRISLYTKYIFKGRSYRRNKLIFRRYDSSILFNIYFLFIIIRFILRLKIKHDINEVNYWSSWVKNSAYIMNKKKTNICLYCNPIYANYTKNDYNFTWCKIFTPFKVICVYRNPYDQLADILRIDGHLQTEPYRFFDNTSDHNPAKRVLTVMKSLHKMRIDLSNKLTSDKLLIISFDDFIKHNQLVSNKINNFLEIEESSFIKNKYLKFNFKMSEKNLGFGAKNEKLKNFMDEYPGIIEEIIEMYNETKVLKQTFRI
jgi:hypothetical protein